MPPPPLLSILMKIEKFLGYFQGLFRNGTWNNKKSSVSIKLNPIKAETALLDREKGIQNCTSAFNLISLLGLKNSQTRLKTYISKKGLKISTCQQIWFLKGKKFRYRTRRITDAGYSKAGNGLQNVTVVAILLYLVCQFFLFGMANLFNFFMLGLLNLIS